jgi:hypothetical protein
MPYKVVKVKGGFKVKTSAGANKGHMHSSKPMPKAKAMAQMRAMYRATGGK